MEGIAASVTMRKKGVLLSSRQWVNTDACGVGSFTSIVALAQKHEDMPSVRKMGRFHDFSLEETSSPRADGSSGGDLCSLAMCVHMRFMGEQQVYHLRLYHAAAST